MQALKQLSRSTAPLRRSVIRANESVGLRQIHFQQRQCYRPISQIASPIKVHSRVFARPQVIRHVRAASTATPSTLPPTPPKRSRLFRFVYRTFAFVGAFIVVSGVTVLAFFAFDASTYREDPSSVDVPISEFALNPRRGGPKNLPIAEHLVDDDESPEKKNQKHKPKLVVLGTGWGSVALLKNINPDEYHITVVSPSNVFTFTPMLPSATVGTLELRSLVEPIRRIVSGCKGHYLKAQAEAVDFSEKLVEISSIGVTGEREHFYLPYDKLIIGTGSITNPHGVKGLEYCHFLKDIDDARMIRNHVITNLEQACLPTTPDDERRRLLSFVISGGGPTGVEFAAEVNYHRRL